MALLPRALRTNPTEAELKLRQALAQLRPRFTKQLKLNPYTADFACRRAKLIVEVDGSHHAGSPNDTRRTSALEADGWAVIRFWNNEVLNNVEGVVTAIIDATNPRLPPGETCVFVVSRAGRARKPRTRTQKEEGPPSTPPRSRGGE